MDYTVLKTMRRGANITQAAMARHLGVSRELMGKYENGEAVPRVDTLEQWCKRLDCELIIKLK